MEPQRRNWSRIKRSFTIVAPLLFVLACLGVINLLPRIASPSDAAVVEPSPVAVQEPLPTQQPPTGTAPPIEPNGITPTPAPTPTQTTSPTATAGPAVPTGVAIRLLGPPDASEFSRQDPVLFYWEFPDSLPEGVTFVLSLSTEVDEQRLNAGETPNLGSAFRLRAYLDEVAGAAETVQWRVILETAAGNVPLLESETRSIRVLPAP